MNKAKENQANNDDWETIEDAEFFQFKEIGDAIEGMLIDSGESKRYGFGLYTVMTKDGEKQRFHGSAQLDGLMANIEFQDYIRVEFVDTKSTDSGQMKIFDVQRKKK